MLRSATPFVIIFSLLALSSCGPADEGEACAVNSDCAPESICHQGKCNAGLRACVNDGECGGGEVCRHGVCKPVIDECQGTWDCASGQVCSQGQCHRPQVGNPCQRHQDCGVAMYCPTPRLKRFFEKCSPGFYAPCSSARKRNSVSAECPRRPGGPGRVM